MGTHYRSGFTIIETLLVLGITGALVAGVFIGVGTSISAQRYRDAASTFKDLIQTQYAELSSVRNDRSGSWACGSSAQTITTDSEDRGQSDCVLLGRLLTVTGSDIAVYSVVGHEVALPQDIANDIQSLRTNYTLDASEVNVETNTLEWGTSISWPSGPGANPTTSSPRSLSMLFVRSPDSGQVYTFSSTVVPTEPSDNSIKDMLIETDTIPGRGALTICIDASGFVANNEYSIVVERYASVPNAVEFSTDQLLQASGKAYSC